MILARSGVAEVVLFVVLRHIGLRNERTDLEEFFSGKTTKKMTTVLVRTRLTNDTALNFF